MPVRFIVVAGPPCAGKSTLARAVAARYGARLLEMDAVLSRLMPQSDRRESDRLIAYRAMLLIAAELLDHSHSVVLDATFTSHECRSELAKCAAGSSAAVSVIQCRVRPDVAVSRFRNRTGHSALDLDEARVRQLAERYPYSEIGLTVDSEQPVADCLRHIVAYIDRASLTDEDLRSLTGGMRESK